MNTNWINFIIDKIPFTGNLGFTFALTIFIFILSYFLITPIYYIVKKIFQKIGIKFTYCKVHITPYIEKPIGLICVAILWLVILTFMPPLWKYMGGIPVFLSTPLIKIIQIIIKITIGYGIIWGCYNITDSLIALLIKILYKNPEQQSNLNNHLVPFLSRISKILILCFGSLLVLQSLNINVASIMAGLGIGGIALALAAKDSASNILAYINIMLDKPFSIGDWIRFKDTEGTIISIGIRSSKLKTFYDSIITVPNAILTSENIDNMGKRKSRRTRIHLGVQYNTSPQKIESFITGIKQILLDNPTVKKDYYQVYFTEFGASDLKIIMNFFLFVTSWENELQHKQDIFIKILKLAKQLEVDFAFPTQTIHVNNKQDNNKIIKKQITTKETIKK